MDKSKIKVAVGLSGGVDSSVTAYLLKEAGYDLTGIIMKIWDGSYEINENSKHACFGPGEEEDVEIVENICKALDIPLKVVDLSKEYKDTVIDYFRKEYLAGRTPNPCVRCNQMMKFGFMLDKGEKLGLEYDFFATGHYARIVEWKDGRPVLKKAVHSAKDQTYFLAGLSRDQLEKTMFPLGGFTKPEVRELAKKFNLETAENPESQDFIAGGDYTPLFKDDKIQGGDIVDESGKKLGEHKGIIHYTVGQRRGLGISAKNPIYVKKIDAENNCIVVSEKGELFSRGLIAGDLNMIIPEILDSEVRIKAKIRQMHEEAPAILKKEYDDKVKVVFDDPQLSVTPGQTVVFYDDDMVMGSGIIEKAVD